MIRPFGAQSSLKPFFLDLTNRSFDQLGFGAQREADYVAELLAEFGMQRSWLPSKRGEARAFLELSEVILQRIRKEQPESATLIGERAYRKHVGDMTLFMTGIFRRFIERNGLLDRYFETGRRSYAELSRIEEALNREAASMFEELSRGFEQYSGAIDYMHKCFFAHAQGDDPFADFVEYLNRRALITRN